MDELWTSQSHPCSCKSYAESPICLCNYYPEALEYNSDWHGTPHNVGHPGR